MTSGWVAGELLVLKEKIHLTGHTLNRGDLVEYVRDSRQGNVVIRLPGGKEAFIPKRQLRR